MKKIILSILVTLSLFASMVSVMATEDAAPESTADFTAFKDNYSYLEGLGIMAEAGTASSEVKRNEFYQHLCKLVNFQSVDHLIEASIALTDEDGKIPKGTSPITYNEAVISVVKALGHGLNLTSQSDYLSKADLLGLTKGLNHDEIFYRADMMQLFVNACDVEVVQLIATSNNSFVFSTESETTLLEMYHKVYELEGVVYEAGGLTADGLQFTTEEHVRIGEEILYAGSVDLSRYLGYYVTAYYRDGGVDDRELVYFEVSPKSTAVTVSSRDIIPEETTRSQFVYIDGAKDVKLKISPIADMIYNGRGYSAFTSDEMTPLNGNVTLIDHDADKVIDLLIVNSYWTLIVNGASSASGEIYGMYGEMIDVDDYYSYMVYKNLSKTERSSLANLTRNDVLYIAEDMDHESVTIFVASQNNFRASVTSFDESEMKLGIDGVEYDINPDYFERIKSIDPEFDTFEFGSYRMWAFDVDGRVAYHENVIDGTAFNYGYYMKHIVNEETDEVKLRILNTENAWNDMPLAKKVTLVKGYTSTTYTNPLSLVEGADENSQAPLVGKQIIRYKTNGRGELTEITLPVESSTITDAENTEIFRHYSISGTYYGENATVNSEYYKWGTRVFTIPYEDDTTVDIKETETPEFYSSGYWNPTAWTYFSGLDAYDIDRFGRVPIVVEYESVSSSNATNSSTVFVIQGISESVIGGEVVKQLKGLLNGQTVNLNEGKEGLFDSLAVGDAIKIAFDSEGKVGGITVVYRAATGEAGLSEINGVNYYSDRWAISAKILEYDPYGFMILQGSDGTRALRPGGAVTIYYRDSRTAQSASLSDVVPGDFAIITGHMNGFQNVIIYREG